MLFTDIVFFPFLCCTFLLFFLAKKSLKSQLFILLTASYLFYGWWNVKFLWLIIFSTLLDYTMGKWIYSAKTKGEKKIYLALSLIGNLGLLGYFKYANFFIGSLQALLTKMGISASLPVLNVVLPVGISFYTFQSLSYSLDIYYGRIKPTKSLLKFMVFVSAFPQLVAGPIVRAKDLLPQLDENLFEKNDDDGIFYILYGLIKKTLIADMLGVHIVDKVFADPASFGSTELLLATYAYAFQIFFDFSAYSDIAIGLGKIFGLQLPVNFRYPYTASNPTQFWRQWHITLSSWLRDYLYIPLGGNRMSQYRTMINIMIVMLLGGLWHGASWTFVIWGFLHGVYVVVYKLIPENKKESTLVVKTAKIFLFFNLLCLTWIFFRASDLSSALVYLRGIFSFDLGVKSLSVPITMILLGVAVFVHYVCETNLKSIARVYTSWHWSFRAFSIYVFFILMSILSEQGIAHKAFIYFQF